MLQRKIKLFFERKRLHCVHINQVLLDIFLYFPFEFLFDFPSMLDHGNRVAVLSCWRGASVAPSYYGAAGFRSWRRCRLGERRWNLKESELARRQEDYINATLKQLLTYICIPCRMYS